MPDEVGFLWKDGAWDKMILENIYRQRWSHLRKCLKEDGARSFTNSKSIHLACVLPRIKDVIKKENQLFNPLVN